MESVELRQQIENLINNPVDYEQQIAQQFDKPIIQPIVQERAGIESQYLPTLFNSLASARTGGDQMNAAGVLAEIGGNLGRLQSRADANQSVLDYYGVQKDNMVNQLAQQRAERLNSLQNLYQTAVQREEAAKDRALQQALSAGQQNNTNSFLESLFSEGGETQGGDQVNQVEGYMNFMRNITGLDDVGIAGLEQENPELFSYIEEQYLANPNQYQSLLGKNYSVEGLRNAFNAPASTRTYQDEQPRTPIQTITNAGRNFSFNNVMSGVNNFGSGFNHFTGGATTRGGALVDGLTLGMSRGVRGGNRAFQSLRDLL